MSTVSGKKKSAVKVVIPNRPMKESMVDEIVGLKGKDSAQRQASRPPSGVDDDPEEVVIEIGGGGGAPVGVIGDRTAYFLAGLALTVVALFFTWTKTENRNLEFEITEMKKTEISLVEQREEFVGKIRNLTHPEKIESQAEILNMKLPDPGKFEPLQPAAERVEAGSAPAPAPK